MSEWKSVPKEHQACAVPLPELLRKIPKDYRVSIPFQWAEDGIETGHHMIPVGHLMHRAADELSAAPSPAKPQLVHEQNARFAIDGAIQYGRQNTNHPPEGHWLTEYWDMGRALATSPAEPGGYDAGYRAGIEAAAKVCEELAGSTPVIVEAAAFAKAKEAIRALPAAQVAEPVACTHKAIIRGNDYGVDLAWCEDCGEITFCSDADNVGERFRTYSDRATWAKSRVVAFGCCKESRPVDKFNDGKRCEIWCNHQYCPVTLRSPAQVSAQSEPRDRYETEGYALAMEVLQSDLYAKLDGKARSECDEFIQRGMAKPADQRQPGINDTAFIRRDTMFLPKPFAWHVVDKEGNATRNGFSYEYSADLITCADADWPANAPHHSIALSNIITPPAQSEGERMADELNDEPVSVDSCGNRFVVIPSSKFDEIITALRASAGRG